MRLNGYTAISQFNYIFSHLDCCNFARLSGDANPLHVDLSYSRRSLAAGCVVHGMLLFLRALDEIILDITLPKVITTNFKSFVKIDDSVNFILYKNNLRPDDWQIWGFVNDKTVITIQLNGYSYQEEPQSLNVNQLSCEVIGSPQLLDSPRIAEHSPFFLKNYSYPLKSFVLSDCGFKNLLEKVGGDLIAGFLSMTNFVGMIHPGLNSIFSKFRVVLNGQNNEDNYQLFQVIKYDDRVNRYVINLSGSLFSGEIVAFQRPGLVEQEHISSYIGKVAPNIFSNLNVLILGGSRGLGAAAAKILALGGANVDITYFACKKEADLIAHEISEHCCYQPKTFFYDIEEKKYDVISKKLAIANLVMNFATPPIRPTNKNEFDAELQAKYFWYYVESILELSKRFASNSNGKKIIFSPSTSFIEKEITGFAEYVSSKKSLELMCDKKSNETNIIFMCERLPQLKTDQTSSVFQQQYGDIFSCLYPIFLKIQKMI